MKKNVKLALLGQALKAFNNSKSALSKLMGVGGEHQHLKNDNNTKIRFTTDMLQMCFKQISIRQWIEEQYQFCLSLLS